VPLNKAIERLIALNGRSASASIVRAKDQKGTGVIRNGTFSLLLERAEIEAAVEAAADEPIATILDAGGLPIVSLLGADRFASFNDLVSVELRSSFRVDILGRPFPRPAFGDDAPYTYQRAARELAAELEAGLRTLLLFRPDPDPAAAVRARHGVPATASAPLKDNSIRFAVGHRAATLVPVDGAISMTCALSEMRPNWQRVHVLQPRGGNRYELDRAAIERLGGDIRAFLFNQLDRFNVLEQREAEPPDAARTETEEAH
jgi:hypothetical protein